MRVQNFGALGIVLALAASGCLAATDDSAATGDEAQANEAALSYGVDLSQSIVTVEERHIGESAAGVPCHSVEAKYRIRYENKTLPWGTKVTLHRGYGGVDNWNIGDGNGFSSTHFSWRDIKDVAMQSVAPWTWGTTTSAPTTLNMYRAWMSGYAQDFPEGELDFVFAIELPNGETIWDTERHPGGYYGATLVPFPSCSGEDLYYTLGSWKGGQFQSAH